MLICDKEWRPLTIGDEYRVPLDHVIALWSFAPLPSRELPRGAAELKVLVERTGMVELRSMSPLTVLTLGNQRYCESRRRAASLLHHVITHWKSRQSGR